MLRPFGKAFLPISKKNRAEHRAKQKWVTRPRLTSCSSSLLLLVSMSKQENTGKVVEGQREYRVTIKNKCSCPQADVKVRCFGVNSVEPLDKSKIRPLDSDLCIITDGKPITKGTPVIFTYAFQTPQSFPVISAKPRC
ncbi:hypothetical protein HU200_013871 [Digitaria exilis]|uniref:Uncharacterized protein n=1 Tax=Digitaria exilis TaxID=1010633 RepID=A0A835FD63_9POAL|nr:hypothetical protein HU200_013871 [Digitaria exilis]